LAERKLRECIMQGRVSHKKEADADKIDEMVRRIAERFDPDQIILFGSHARGTARHDSDVDLLVVMPVTGSKRETRIEIRCALHDIHVAKDIIVATPDEVERQRNIVGTIIRPALREGKVLYARGR
jgi:predicted nucleotidyltransferase